MAIRFDQTTSWILASLVAGGIFFGIYFTFRQVAKHRDDEAVAAGKAQLGLAKGQADAAGSESNASEFLPDAPSLWGYSGSRAPSQWASLDEGFSLCGKGKRQSPVDIGDAINDSRLKPILFEYKDSGVSLGLNSGDLSGQIEDGSFIEFEGDRFTLDRLVIHLPAEHRRSGVPFPMEVQLHHKDVAGNRLNIAIFVEKGRAGAALSLLTDTLPAEDLHSREIPDVPWSTLLPSKKNYFTYIGSLSQPPCTEGVRWIILTDFIELDQERINKVRKLVSNNARPVQSMNGREMKRSIR